MRRLFSFVCDLIIWFNIILKYQNVGHDFSCLGSIKVLFMYFYIMYLLFISLLNSKHSSYPQREQERAYYRVKFMVTVAQKHRFILRFLNLFFDVFLLSYIAFCLRCSSPSAPPTSSHHLPSPLETTPPPPPPKGAASKGYPLDIA